MQPCKLQCCHMKRLIQTETLVFFLFVLFLSMGNFYRFYLSNSFFFFSNDLNVIEMKDLKHHAFWCIFDHNRIKTKEDKHV